MQFECLGENTEKYITFSVITKNDANKKCKLKFVDSFGFMSPSLSSLIGNLSKEPHNDKCKDWKSFLDYMLFKDNQLRFKSLKCGKNHSKEFNKDLINRFTSTYRFCDEDIYKFILLLRKGIYPYEYMDSWGKFDDISLPNKKSIDTQKKCIKNLK